MSINADYDYIYQMLVAERNGGKLYLVNGKESAMSEWENLSDQEKISLIMIIADKYSLDLTEAVTVEAGPIIQKQFLEMTETISTIENQCNTCGKEIRPTKITQFDWHAEGRKLTEDDLPAIVGPCCAL